MVVGGSKVHNLIHVGPSNKDSDYGNCLILTIFLVSLPPQSFSLSNLFRFVSVKPGSGALSGEERVQFLKVVTDDEPYEHC